MSKTPPSTQLNKPQLEVNASNVEGTSTTNVLLMLFQLKYFRMDICIFLREDLPGWNKTPRRTSQNVKTNKKTRLSVSGHGWLTWIRFQLQWKMRFRKEGRYRRSKVEGAPHYSNNFVRCGVEVICHSTFRSGYRF